MRGIFLLVIFQFITIFNLSAQNNPPVIDSILTPYNNQIFSYPNIFMEVFASDSDDGIKSAECNFNNKGWEKMVIPFFDIDGWLINLDLDLGMNTIKIRAVDSLDLISDEVSLTVYYEIGNAENWTQQESGTSENLNSLFFVNENLGWAVGDSGVILNTDNGGLTWNTQNSKISTDLYTVYFVNKDIGWTAGQGEYDSTTGKSLTPLLRTTNGGNEWEFFDEVEMVDIFDIVFLDSSNGWIAGGYTDEGSTIYQTTDGGVSWISEYQNPSDFVVSLAVLDGNNIWGVGEDINHNRAFYTLKGSSYWEKQEKNDYSKFYDVELISEHDLFIIAHRRRDWIPFGFKSEFVPTVTYFNKLNDDPSFRRTESVHILKSTNGGNTWGSDSLGIKGPIINADFLDSQTGWLVGNYGLIMHTTNGGVDWIEDGSVNGKTLNSVQFINETVGYSVGKEGTILKYDQEPIPVELISLNALLDNDKVLLNWSTATETNNKGFEIYRKKSGERSQETEWDLLGYVEGKGTTTELKNYLFKDEKPLEGKNIYKLKQIDFNGTFSYSNIVEVDVNLIPQKFELSQNYPNPFNPSTVIKYSLPKEDQVKLTIFSILGEEVKILVNEKQSTGKYEIKFDGSGLSNGIYFYRLESGSFVEVKKMVLMK